MGGTLPDHLKVVPEWCLEDAFLLLPCPNSYIVQVLSLLISTLKNGGVSHLSKGILYKWFRFFASFSF